MLSGDIPSFTFEFVKGGLLDFVVSSSILCAQSGFRTMEEPQTSAASTLSSNCIVLLLEEKIGGPLQNWGLDTT